LRINNILTFFILLNIILAQDNISGRMSLSTFANFSEGFSNSEAVRIRPRLSFQADNLRQSKFSLSGYLNADYRRYTDENKTNSNRVRVYDLAAKYELNESINLTFGRKINQKISNLGVIDGFQIDKSWEKLSGGLIIGSRPDMEDFGINLNLFEAGMYFGYSDNNHSSTIALTQQMNGRAVDRRSLYFSHHNRISNKFRYYFNSDIDLYKKIDGVAENTFRLTGLYVSATYRPTKKLSLTTAYNSRRNIIYYETFKTYAEQLYDDETRKGLKFRFNWKPIKFMYLGANTGYRFKSSDNRNSYNYSVYLGHSKIPVFKMLTRFTGSKVVSNYLDGTIYDLYLSKPLFNNYVTLSTNLKFIDYYYINSGTSLKQKQISSDISWQLKSKMSFTLSYIGNFEGPTNYSQLYFIISQRF